MGHDENALECFENVLDKDPKNITAHILKSEALFMLQRVDDALLFFEKAAISNPNNLTVYFRMGGDPNEIKPFTRRSSSI